MVLISLIMFMRDSNLSNLILIKDTEKSRKVSQKSAIILTFHPKI